MKKFEPTLSIIIPVYNEQNRLYHLSQVLKYTKKLNYQTEIIVVNDGSTDQTLKLLQKYKSKNIKVLSYNHNQGKGFAIKTGMLKAKGKYHLFFDVDLATPLSSVKQFVSLAQKENLDIIIGSRKIKGSNIKKRQPIIRENLGKGFTWLSKTLFNVEVGDFTCGFKLFSKRASRKIFSQSKINRWGFDTEILFLATRLGYNITEIPVTWIDKTATKVNLKLDIARSLTDLVKIKYYELTNKYQIQRWSTITNLFQKKHLVSIVIITLISLLILWPTFSLSLWGDDWLSFFRFKYHLGEWSNGNFNYLTYFLTVYGPEDMSIGILELFVGYKAIYYYAISYILRLLAGLAIYYFIYINTKKTIPSLLAGLFFTITYIGADTTNWVFNMPSYLGIILFIPFLHFFVKSILKHKFIYVLYAWFFYYFAFIVAPIRLHGIPFFVIAMELFNIIKTKKITTLSFTRQILMLSVIGLVKISGSSLGVASSRSEVFLIYLDYLQQTIPAKDYSFFIVPFTLTGKLFYPEKIISILTTNAKPIYRYSAIYSLLLSSPILITTYHYLKNNKKIFYFIISSITFYILFLKYYINVSNTGNNFLIYIPAIIGFIFYTTAASLALIEKDRIKSTLFTAAVFWTFFSYFFAHIRSPGAYFETSHRYMIIPAVGIALYLGTLILYSNKQSTKLLIYLFGILMIFTQSLLTHNFFTELKSIRSVEIAQNTWGSLPYIPEILSEEGPHVFYFKGDQSILYHNITFGFPPHMALHYHTNVDNQIPVPISDWNELITAYQTGENMYAYGFPKEPVPLEKIYAFKLNSNNELVNVTKETRLELQKISTN